MYENTDAAHPPDRRRPDRSRGRRRRHLPPPLRARADREAAAASPRALDGIQRHCDGRLVAHLHHRRRLRGDRRRRGDDRGDHRPPALDRGGQGRRPVRDQGDARPRRPQGQPALQRRRRRRLRDRPRARAAAATSAPPASPPTSSSTSWSSSSAARSAPSSTAERGRRRAPARCCSATSRPGSPRTTWSPGSGASAACKAGHAGTLDPFATGLLLVLLGPGDPAAALPHRPAEDLPGDGAARLALEHRRPRRRADRDRARPRARWSCRPARSRQRVPMTSAVRVGGERLYRKAHRGEVVETPRARGRGLPGRAARQRRRRARQLRDRVLGRAPTSAP